MNPSGRLVLSSDFLAAYGGLPKPQQRNLRALIDKFSADSTASGINYERIHGLGDSAMRSVRIDRSYRAIVLKPERGNDHILLWADKHDEAYQWASRHGYRVNRITGDLQIYPIFQYEPPEPPEPAPASDNVPPGAFAGLRDRQLLRLGVPEAMVGEIRAARGEDDLEAIKSRLPVEAYEALFLYLAGDSYEDLIRQREIPQEEIDPEDYAAALDRDGTLARFVVVGDDEELEAMLNAPLERWRVFLHPSQRRLVERNWNGPVRVLGGAGTGKTVVATHRARWLVRNEPSGGRILFVTFTKNLATDIHANLSRICSTDELDRIEVRNLDRWVTHFLRRNKYEFDVIYERDRKAWKTALALKPDGLDLSDAFYGEEWEQVVQENGVTTLEEYSKVSRFGRGTRLNRSMRKRIWPVFEEYRLQLAQSGKKEVEDAYRDAAALLADDPSKLDYTAVIVDEAQDMGSQAYRLIRAIAPAGKNDLFITGDGHQRIYGARVVLGRCGIDIRGRSRKLRLNYRTTEQTRSWAANLLDGREIDDLDGGADDNRGIRSLTSGPAPIIRHLESREEQTEELARYLREVQEQNDSPLGSVCVVARTRAERDSIVTGLKDAGLPVVVLGTEGDDHERAGVRAATMHRVKGLEFDRVVIASMNKRFVPLRHILDRAGDELARQRLETRERSLVYVAATRAKRELVILSWGQPSEFCPLPPDASASPAELAD